MAVAATNASSYSSPLPVMNIPESHGMVESGIYRSSALKAHNLPFVSTLRLKTLLHLSPEPLPPAVLNFLQQSSIKLVHLGAREAKPASWKPMSEKMVKEALEIVLDATTHPVMVTCSSGTQRTGTLVGCLRRLQKWNLTSIIEEYRRYTGNKAHYASEQFVELFDEGLVKLPQNVVSWFADQHQMMQDELEEFERQVHDRLLQESTKGCSSWQVLQPPPKDFESCSSYARLYYYSSCPLTTEVRYHKQRGLRKVD